MDHPLREKYISCMMAQIKGNFLIFRKSLALAYYIYKY
jgi:hypothetical protein